MKQTLNDFIASLVGKDKRPAKEAKHRKREPLVMLGALLSKVAAADGQIAVGEEKEIKKVLRATGHKSADTALVLKAARQAIADSIDLHGFTRDFARLPYKERLELLGKLFRVAAADGELANNELEKIRRISKLLWVTNRDFIKLKVATLSAIE